MSDILRPYTEEELRRSQVGKYVDSQMGYGKEDKKRCYREQGIWTVYSKLRSYYRKCVTDETGWVDHDLATRVAQRQVDTFLILRAQGKEIAEPAVSGEGVQSSHSEDGEELFNIEEFGGREGMDPITDLTWIYNHLAVKGVKPGDAPNPGVYAHLRFIQKTQENMADFFTKVYPRIIPSKSDVEDKSKFRDDGRENFELLERVLKEGEGTPEPLPVL